MPLLRKTPFRRCEAPKDIQPDDYVFVCDSTKEAFKDYDDFFRKTILCNSMVWSCSLTGKTGLTFEEAIESEKKAKERLGVLPKNLKVGLLWVAHHTRRGRLSDLVDDVYKFAYARFFIGEKIEAVIGDLWCESLVKGVVAPSPEQVEEFLKSYTDNDKGKKKGFEPHDSLFKYNVLETDPDDPENNPIVTVSAEDIRREKYFFTRDKILLFLKNASEFASDGNFKLKKSIIDKYNVNEVKFSDIFSGPLPTFEETKRIKGSSSTSALNKKTKQSSMDQFLKGESKTKKTAVQIEADMKKIREQNERFKEEMRQRAEDAKKRKIEEKAKEKERKKEEKKLFNELMSEATKPVEDLICEDHKELPQPKPIHCRVPNHLFGDFLMLIEFYNGFSEVLETKDSFPQGITFEILETALCTSDSMSSDLTDILSFTLGALFDLQREEEEEVKMNRSVNVSTDIDKNILGKSEDIANHIRSATLMSQWARKTQGKDLKDLHLDKWSITEILRVHLESAGAYYGDKLGLWRFQQRGGFRMLDDPGLHFRMDQPQILDALSKKTVFELSIQDKLKVLTCLCDQILSFANVRDEIDDRFHTFSENKTELRNHQLIENRRLRQIEESKKAKSKEEKLKKEEPPVLGNSTEMTTRQKEIIMSQKEKEEKDRLKKEEVLKSEASEREKELSNKVAASQSKVIMTCLGRDRSYRRFWVLGTIPGIFVEDDDEFVGPCLTEPTPYNPNVEPFTEAVALERAKEILNARENQQSTTSPSASSDKENKVGNSSLKSSAHSRKNQQKVLGAKNGATEASVSDNSSSNSTNESNLNTNIEESTDLAIKEEGGKPSGLCLADMENCPVHSTILPKTRWSFFSSCDDVDSLIDNLNPRGVRERELRERLIAEKRKIYLCLNKFEIETKLIQPDFKTDGSTDLASVIDIALRDQILDLEEKIFFGTLGTLKIQSREKWQSALQNGDYDKQCDILKWNGSISRDTPIDSHTASRSESPTMNGVSQESSSKEYSNKVRDLSSAILQIGQMVDEKFLKEPLSESEKEKKKRLKEEKKKEEDENEDTSKAQDILSPLQFWERSLMNCTSYAQLFIHLTTLENSIVWSRSTMNARCRICRRKSDPENMLLCDGCDRGHHMYCLKPALKTVPVDDWFCSECKPKQRIRSPKKTRRVFSTTEEDDNDDSDNLDAAQNQSDVSDNEESVVEEEELEEDKVDESDNNEMNHEEMMELDDEIVNDSPRQRKSKKKQKIGGKSGSSPEAPLPPSKKKSKITQLLGKRRSATEANEKIHKTAQESSSSGNNSGAETSENKGGERSLRASGRSKSKRNLDPQLLSSSTPDEKNVSKKRNRTDEEEGAEDYRPTVLEDLLNSMMKHPSGWPFDRPITKADAPDYHKIIKKPMDLGTIRSNLNRMKYKSNDKVLRDIKLVFENCFRYNREEVEEYRCGVRLEQFFNKEVERLGFTFPSPSDSEEKRPSKRKRKTL
ncbi:bromodomain adjacent to zinc finger domain protein 1A isoform X2 [Lepeophtheirus salmonis]|uniref:bromodomain adjacent to zinc finger domain protein 1A isoform X2 n=1 Tax=Lepeophtheirus salmonis TaxID=72036 RepID=UPI001AE4DD0A|nr:bromodomain adjacent to zinc finger domain protein 1A-like isoform X2 [Lepeophtheirus salmonis]